MKTSQMNNLNEQKATSLHFLIILQNVQLRQTKERKKSVPKNTSGLKLRLNLKFLTRMLKSLPIHQHVPVTAESWTSILRSDTTIQCHSHSSLNQPFQILLLFPSWYLFPDTANLLRLTPFTTTALLEDALSLKCPPLI